MTSRRAAGAGSRSVERSARRAAAANDGELARIERLRALFERSAGRSPAVELGIGDDAAVLKARGSQALRLVWTVDACVEGVHFERAWLAPEDIGCRAFEAAASDLAAMGARPLAALANLCLPPAFSERALAALARGQARAAARLGCPIVGGNLSRARELSVVTTLLGTARAPLRRDGARAGDELWLTGDVGLSAAGLLALRRGGRRRPTPAVRACIERFRRPEALIDAGLALVGRARAALDVSDGLAGDAAQLARASGVRVVVELAALERALRPELVRAAAELGRDALALALAGGEDYALLASGPAQRRPRGARRIGFVERGRGVFLLAVDGGRRRAGAGFDHFR